ncbi:hypothetical protein H0H87_003231, partial [Tephrocybe sp. NHM501043]
MARHAGVKRKRVTSQNTSNENASHSIRTRTRSKRLRSDSLTSTRRVDDSTASEGEEGEEQTEEVAEDAEDEEGAPSEMDVDVATTRGSDSEASETLSDEQTQDLEDEGEAELSDEDEQDDSTDDFLLNTAQPKQLNRLRKDDLIRLYQLADLSDDPESMTKSDIVSAIIVSREEDFASLPPSSPPGRGDGFSSEGVSSDDEIEDGNEAEDEETDAGISINGTRKNRLSSDSSGLRRRTLGEVKKSKTLKGRSVSMGHLLPQRRGSGKSTIIQDEGNSMARRRSSNRSFPTTSTHASISSPLATRLRSRKVATALTRSISTPLKPFGGKGKGKQVEFNHELVPAKNPSRRSREKEKQREETASLMDDDESELTSLEDLEVNIAKPSPRRLRSKDRGQPEKSRKTFQRPTAKAMKDEDDVDLTIATAKTLVRLRRDDLIRLCESHDLQPVGTKPQLAEALLQWRDRQANDFSSPSSCGTVRPLSRRRRKNGHKSSEDTRPVLLRSDHTHTDEPMTPVPTQQLKDKERLEKEPDQELELDLESLGLEDREIPPEKIQKLEKIGSGGFKDVFIGKFKGRKIAISEFRGQLSAMDIKELKLLGGFDHPNIVRFLGVSIPENTRETPVMIVSELCSNGDLFDYVRNVHAPTLHKVLVMMLDIARGLEYLHLRKPSVIHRDCKSSNILITAKGTAKIADFGLAKVKQSTRSMVRSLVGTVNWQAPELWHAHPKYNHKVDVFSCAMVYWEMLQWHLQNKKFPWEGMNEHAIYEIVGTKRQRCVISDSLWSQLTSSSRPSVSGLRKQWCPEIVDLIERMWAQDHQERPTMSEVVEALEEMVSHR